MRSILGVLFIELLSMSSVADASLLDEPRASVSLDYFGIANAYEKDRENFEKDSTQSASELNGSYGKTANVLEIYSGYGARLGYLARLGGNGIFTGLILGYVVGPLIHGVKWRQNPGVVLLGKRFSG